MKILNPLLFGLGCGLVALSVSGVFHWSLGF